MAAQGDATPTSPSREADASATYILHDLIRDIPLSTTASDDEDNTQPYITCVDAWNGNLYIGTSNGEVLHYVAIRPDPSDDAGQETYIFATKLEPHYRQRQHGPDAGVKQILVLPNAGKACILCHGTLNFYTLPELSPAFGGQIQLNNCIWVGGLDASQLDAETNTIADSNIVICLRNRLRLIQVPSNDRAPTRARNIELPNVSAIQRRGDLACVADSGTYALLDIVNQRKNDLFPISSMALPEQEPANVEYPPRVESAAAHSMSSSQSPSRSTRSHERNRSIASQSLGRTESPAEPDASFPRRSTSQARGSPAPRASAERNTSDAGNVSAFPTEAEPKANIPPASSSVAEPLWPNIATPSEGEFLLTTGTRINDPGVGLFVNVDGDPIRGTLEFSSYPESLVIDGMHSDDSTSKTGVTEQEGHVLAMVRRQTAEGLCKAIEIQRWDTDPSEATGGKEWINVGRCTNDRYSNPCGLRIASSASELSIPEISLSLRIRRFDLEAQNGDHTEEDVKRNKEEDRFVQRFAQVKGNVIFYSQSRVSWVTRNALIVRLERQLNLAIIDEVNQGLRIDLAKVQHTVNSIRGQEPQNELDFLTLTYTRQKAALLFFGHLLIETAANVSMTEPQKRVVEDALSAGDIDPRVILSLIEPLAIEVTKGDGGIWIAQGLIDTAKKLRDGVDFAKIVQDPQSSYGRNILSILKRYLLLWRNKKGLASVADDTHVFRSVDAALIHVILLLDQASPRGPAVPGTIRAELNEIVDSGVDNFERAIELFEEFDRLYMLSRLYQHRKMATQVLGTWKRILEGDHDSGGELVDGEHQLRQYLTRIRDKRLVQGYGTWLANRNAKLGVQVFADDSSKVKFEPAEAVAILREHAPGAVKDYLENLVFVKKHVQYVNELIAFYLDTVLERLDGSEQAKQALLVSYETYRALRPPKPTYRHFIEDNANELEWQQNRLHLLRLIGGSRGAASEYDVHALRERLEPYSQALVPEMIILNGREGRHQDALRLLVHGLADYDTAVRYCLLGGRSIFHPTSHSTSEQPLPSKEEQSILFEHLLQEFFRIEDTDEQAERTAELLERFGGWFDVADVLSKLPDSWSVGLVSGFLQHAFRELVQDRRETDITMALASVQNLKRSVDLMEKIEATHPILITEPPNEFQ